MKVDFVVENINAPYSKELLAEQLCGDRIITQHGDEYTGRPVTEMVRTEIGLIKFRTEYKLADLEARRFIMHAIEQERRLGVYHPDKTWFLVTSQDETKINIANIAPLLKPLHQYQTLLSEFSIDEFLQFIEKAIRLYVETASQHELALDLSLSNFGIDKNHKVYYLDDDVYRWNQFIDLPEFLAGLIRSLEFLDDTHLTRLGEGVRAIILDNFNDKHWLTVVAEGMRNLFIPNERESLREAIIKSLYSTDSFSYEPKETAKLIALIADIHANAPALETALDYIASRNINDVIVLGDIVGYGPHPKQCIDLLRHDTSFSIIRGNHDHAVATGKTVAGATSLAGWTLNWTIDNLDTLSKQWLAALPCYLQTEGWLAVHGSPRDKTFFNGYVYQMNYVENLDTLAERNIRFCFHGHTHIQKIYYRERGVDFESVADIADMSRMSQLLICPGSIGQPRGGNPGVELAIINLESEELEFVRLSYDMSGTIRDMGKYFFPKELSDRLEKGF